VTAEPAAEELLGALVATARLPRRVAERTRLAVGAQRSLRGALPRRRRTLVHQSYFEDALRLLEISVRATGRGAEELARWRSPEAAHPQAPAEGGPPAPVPHAIEQATPGSVANAAMTATNAVSRRVPTERRRITPGR